MLKKFDEDNFPLRKYIINVANVIDSPSYVNSDTVYDLSDLVRPLISLSDVESDEAALSIPELSEQKFVQSKSIRIQNESQWPDAKCFDLDESQYAALKAALTKQLVIIQGPPG